MVARTASEICAIDRKALKVSPANGFEAAKWIV